MSRRFDILHRIQQLDPKADCQEIVYLVGAYEYPWLLRKSLEFALFRTYAVPHTSRILRATGQFQKHGQKRYDDTTLMLATISEQGYDSAYGKQAIARMNDLHGRYNIRNEDMLYVLSTFIYEPIRWHEKYGWRKPTNIEKLANFYFWREVGLRMGLEDVPEDIADFERFNIEHEAKYFHYDEANRTIGEATLQIFLHWYPAFLRPMVREGLYAMMDDLLLKAMAFPKPHGIIRWMVRTGLCLAGRILRYMPPRSQPFHLTEQPNRTYPQGFTVRELGPQHPVDAAEAGAG